MSDIKEVQKEFFETLSYIQDFAVNRALAEHDEKESLEDLLYSATYEAIVYICELIDGYANDKLQLDLIDRRDHTSLRTDIELHDVCPDYVKWRVSEET